MKSREYWDDAMEKRYKSGVSGWSKQPLHVFLIPHSHNDPGWVKTVDMYFHYQTRRILNNLVEKLTQHRNMTFIWTEVFNKFQFLHTMSENFYKQYTYLLLKKK